MKSKIALIMLCLIIPAASGCTQKERQRDERKIEKELKGLDKSSKKGGAKKDFKKTERYGKKELKKLKRLEKKEFSK